MLCNDLDSLLPQRDLNRRDFVRTAVGSGFAAAVLPVGAQTIKTDSVGLSVGEVSIPVGDFRMPAYPDTPHAFHADYRPSYRKRAADDGWKTAPPRAARSGPFC